MLATGKGLTVTERVWLAPGQLAVIEVGVTLYVAVTGVFPKFDNLSFINELLIEVRDWPVSIVVPFHTKVDGMLEVSVWFNRTSLHVAREAALVTFGTG